MNEISNSYWTTWKTFPTVFAWKQNPVARETIEILPFRSIYLFRNHSHFRRHRSGHQYQLQLNWIVQASRNRCQKLISHVPQTNPDHVPRVISCHTGGNQLALRKTWGPTRQLDKSIVRRQRRIPLGRIDEINRRRPWSPTRNWNSAPISPDLIINSYNKRVRHLKVTN